MRPVAFPVKILFSGLNYQPQSAAALAALRSIVERGGNFHLLQSVWIWQGHGIKVGEVKVVDVDALQRHAVVAGTLTIDSNVSGTATGGAHICRVTSNSG